MDKKLLSITNNSDFPVYTGDKKQDGNIVFDKDLFYVNDGRYSAGDPFVLNDTERTGWYYLFRTGTGFPCSRSKDLIEWEEVGKSLGTEGSIEGVVAYSYNWAPEIVFNKDDGLYYMFFSATPDDSMDFPAGEGIQEKKANRTTYLARSKCPYGPYSMVNFRDEKAKADGYYHEYNTKTGLREKTGENQIMDSKGYVMAFPQKYIEYEYFNPELFRTTLNRLGFEISDMSCGAGVPLAIDLDPFIDSKGNKYLYCMPRYELGSGDFIFGIKMKDNNWLTPDYSTARALTQLGKYTTDEDSEFTTYERPGVRINEGAFMVEHNGKFYLTMSIHDTSRIEYAVIQCIGDTPLGPFRKMREEEGAVIESCDRESNYLVSGPGHHCFVDVDGRKYIVPHRNYGGYNEDGWAKKRSYSIDRVKWIDITDKDGKPCQVLYCNGGTVAPTPKPVCEYQDVAERGKAKLVFGKTEKGHGVEYLVDGFLSINKYENKSFNDKYIKETCFTEDSRVSISFDSPKKAVAFMIYNSKNREDLFYEIVDIKLTCVDGERNIKSLKFDESYLLEKDGVKDVVRGAHVFAEFEELELKELSFTVKVPEGQKRACVSMVTVLAKE